MTRFLLALLGALCMSMGALFDALGRWLLDLARREGDDGCP